MASADEVWAAERGRLEAIVAEHCTESEQIELLFSRVLRNGTVEDRVLTLPPDPEKLKLLARRAERRSRLGLPAEACAGDPPNHYCSCLERALDESGDGGKAHILKHAAALHWSPPPRRERARPAPEEEPQPAASPSRPNAAEPPRREPEPERPFRVVRHFKRWYDRDEGPSGFAEMKF